MDLANMLKAGLDRGEIKVVGDKEDGTVFFVKFH